MSSSGIMSCSANDASHKDGDEILVKHHSQFSESLKDLKNLRQQLYSAAEYFESSYNRDSRKQFVVDSSKDYVAKALVNTVDHLGSVADKLNKFLDQKANEYSATNTRFSHIEQRLYTIQRLVYASGLSQHSYRTNDTSNQKHCILPSVETSTLPLDKSNVLYGNCISSLFVPEPRDVKQENSFQKTIQVARKMKPLMRKEDSRREALQNPSSFSFTNKEAGKRSVSPLRLPFNLSISRRSVSPSPTLNRGQLQQVLEPRRAMSASRRRETSSREMEMESYTRKSKHLLKALLSLHQSRKAILNKQ